MNQDFLGRFSEKVTMIWSRNKRTAQCILEMSRIVTYRPRKSGSSHETVLPEPKAEVSEPDYLYRVFFKHLILSG